jgi:Di-haem oxidoreductase, putative peroxidase
MFCDPDPTNPGSGPFKTFNDTSQSYCFDLRRTSGLADDGMVRAYTDLKRRVICDANKPHYCSEPTSTLQPDDSATGLPFDQFLTAKLWDVGNSAPFGHRGDLDTIYAAIVAHGGEATSSEAQYEGLPNSDQAAIVAFLKTLRMPIIPADPNPQQAGSPSP